MLRSGGSIVPVKLKQLEKSHPNVWLLGNLSKIDAAGHQIEIVISGFGEPPPLPDLAADLQSNLDPEAKVKLKVVPSQVLRYPELAPD
jgi:hypothetical protein